jgi:hypothetical protein
VGKKEDKREDLRDKKIKAVSSILHLIGFPPSF